MNKGDVITSIRDERKAGEATGLCFTLRTLSIPLTVCNNGSGSHVHDNMEHPSRAV
jgi:hypothetical protein